MSHPTTSLQWRRKPGRRVLGSRVGVWLAVLGTVVGVGTTLLATPHRETPHHLGGAPVVLAARSADGRPITRVLTGERWFIVGKATPAAGAVMTVTVRRDGAVIQTSAVSVPRGAGVRVPVRVLVPGRLTVRAVDRATGSASEPITVEARTAGRPVRGCAGTALVKLATADPPPVVGPRDPAGAGMLLWPGARAVVPEGGRLTLVRDGVRYSVAGGAVEIGCRGVRLLRGSLRLAAPADQRGYAALSVGGAEVSGLRAGTRLSVRMGTILQLDLLQGGARVASARSRQSSLAAEPGDVVLIGSRGLPRLNTWPFARSPQERAATRRDRLPSLWADGVPCSVGCRPVGARTGWPLKPFHAQHALRSGLNELRPANLHIGIDIQALDGTRVYALQSGYARIAGIGTVDERVQVGDYVYWHVIPSVSEGQYVQALRTVVGVVLPDAGHLHLSELGGDDYLNPLRPGGCVLAPYRDTERPVIGRVRRLGDTMLVDVFDPQSYRVTLGYRTPVLAPAAVAWRARDARGRSLSPLTFVYRGTHHLANAWRWIYGPGTHRPDTPGPGAPGWACFRDHEYCVPRWSYRLSGLPPGTTSVTVYAWDWTGNVSVRESGLRAQAARPPAR